MGVYIKGMEMPLNCSSCQFCFGANNICPWVREYATCKGRHSDCPLVEVPPHGRLIDADKLTERLDGIWDCNDIVFEDDNICDRIHADCNSCRWRETRDYITDHVIKHAPTIIEAEENEDNE